MTSNDDFYYTSLTEARAWLRAADERTYAGWSTRYVAAATGDDAHAMGRTLIREWRRATALPAGDAAPSEAFVRYEALDHRTHVPSTRDQLRAAWHRLTGPRATRQPTRRVLADVVRIVRDATTHH